MRVITGSARGRKLSAPAGLETRPTSEMAKEAIFSILQNETEGSRVLDLFAGSGQLGIEALSRGAQSAVFVDEGREAAACVRANLKNTGFEKTGSVHQTDAAAYLKNCGMTFHIALLDPPYGKGLLEAVFPLLERVMEPSGVIVCETERKESLPECCGAFQIYREYRYGKAKVTVYRIPEEE